MTNAVYYNFGDVDLVFEDTLSSGTFTGWCGIQQMEWDRTADISTTMIPNCDPELPGTPINFEKSRAESITASGTIDGPSKKRLDAWWAAKAKRNIKLIIKDNAAGSLANGGGVYAGLAILTSLKITGTEHTPWQFSLSILVDGEMAFTPAAS